MTVGADALKDFPAGGPPVDVGRCFVEVVREVGGGHPFVVADGDDSWAWPVVAVFCPVFVEPVQFASGISDAALGDVEGELPV